MRRGGRLVLLLGVIIAAAAALFLLFFLRQPPGSQPVVAVQTTEPPKKRVVIARIDIPSNTVLTDTETYLQTGDISEAEYNAQPAQYFTNAGELQGKVTVNEIRASQPVRKGDVQDAGLSIQIPAAAPNAARPKAFTLAVDSLSGVADQIKSGDFVDVITSFRFTRTFLRPSFNDQGQVIIKEDQISDLQSTKTLVQNIQVLKVIKPAAAPEGTATPAGAQPSGPPPSGPSGQTAGQTAQSGQPGTGETLTAGSWVLVLAVTDQQAEIIKLSREQGNGITLVLRGRGDTAVENTVGATIDLLVTQFGLPLPNPVAPALFSPNQLTEVPTVAAPSATPGPTTTP